MVFMVLQEWREQPAMVTEHISFMQDLIADNRLLVTGPFTDEVGGGMFLLEATSIEAVEALLEEDVAVATGALLSTVRPYQLSYMRALQQA